MVVIAAGMCGWRHQAQAKPTDQGTGTQEAAAAVHLPIVGALPERQMNTLFSAPSITVSKNAGTELETRHTQEPR